MTGFNITENILIKLCKLEFSNCEKDEISELIKKVPDWEEYVRKANEQGIIALCWYNLSACGVGRAAWGKNAETQPHLGETGKGADEEGATGNRQPASGITNEANLQNLKPPSRGLGVFSQTGDRQLSTSCDGSDYILENVMKHLHAGYLKSLARNTAIYELLKEVLEIRGSENIKVVLLKGLALEKSVYGNKGLRQMNDLDILVKKEDAIKLRKLLLENGFESMPMISPLHEKILPNYGKHLPEMIKNGLSVEIHFRLFDEKEEKLTDEIFDTAIKDENGYYMPVPSLHFIYLVKHLISHEVKGHSQLRLYADLVNMLEQNGEEIISGINNRNISLTLKDIIDEKLQILKNVFGVEIPGTAWGVRREACKRKFNPIRQPAASNQQPATTHDRIELKTLQDFNSIKEKLMYVTGYLFPSFEFMKYRYRLKTSFKAVLWYPVRWFTGIKSIFNL